jgi:hypothetical protein
VGKKHPKDPDFFKIVRGPATNRQHIKNCNSGYYREGFLFSQIHHILPISSVADSHIYDTLKDYTNFMIIRKCLMVTDWNIHDSHNTIGLPVKMAFVARPARKWGGLPCHTVDHDAYYKKLIEELKENVWIPALRKAKECELNYQDFRGQLRANSSTRRSWLINRGSVEEKGTKYCWRNRHKIEKWYVPFSMHPGTPRKRAAPPSWEELSKDFEAAFKKLMKMGKP